MSDTPQTHRMHRIVVYAIVYVSAGSIFFLPLTMPVLRSTSDFSIYNTGWNGCSQLARRLYDSGKEVFPLHTPLSTIRKRPEDSHTALLVIGPTRPFTRGDAEFVADFARRGGTVMVANDLDEGNSLLEGLGLDARFSPEQVGDLCFEKDPFVVTCHALAEGDVLMKNVSTFTLNYPVALMGVPENATVLAATSRMSWLDLDADRVWQRETENRGPFAVLVSLPYGEGEIILLSDPSIFINEMIDATGNEQLYENLVSHLTSSEVSRIYIDEEHHVIANPMEIFTVVIRRTPDYPRLIIVWILVTVIMFVIHPRLREGGIHAFDATISLALRILSLGARESAPESTDPVEQCILKHPDWDREMIERIARST